MNSQEYQQTGQQVIKLHEALRQEWPQLKRIAVALYDAQTDELHTFVNATTGGSPINHYTKKLSDVPSLVSIQQSAAPRIIQDLSIFSHHKTEHSQKIIHAGFRSSFTLPMLTQHHKLIGFIFFDADEIGFFSEAMQKHLLVYAELIQSLIMTDILPLRMAHAAVNMTQSVTRFKDEETSDHMARVAHYARLIAVSIADKRQLDDELVNYILLYASLHDIGKIAIPDNILLKAGVLTSDEFAIMQTHVSKGVEIIDQLIEEFDIIPTGHVSILRNIVAYHHERMDGSGYPFHLAGNDIPIESRIVAVADVFDALTSDRPYHRARCIDEALAYLEAYSGQQFDADCVNALISHREQVVEIKNLFKQRTD
jgi:HD-GYP domain-containing protein (c-di-GMP phosphodiesterase class II)